MVHPCSQECMKTSDYHKEMDEIEFDRINQQKQRNKLTVATADDAKVPEPTCETTIDDQQKQRGQTDSCNHK